MDEKNQNQLSIDLPADVAEGIYSNIAVVSHSQSEFIVDFLRMMPGLPKAKVMSRVILTPEHAKKLLEALQTNIQKFESEKTKGNVFPQNFGSNPAQA